MRGPFWIDPEQPTGVSFSGGRSSAYMLWRILDANSGLPENTRICFANTGKEAEATLRFVRECGARWQAPITWIEYRDDPVGFALVDFAGASRRGEPFEALIRKRRYLPNPVARLCTGHLKVKTMHRFLRQCGWEEWDQCIGIRADEPRRVAKIRARGHSTESSHETMCLPLADAGVTVRDVAAFWKAQPFDLELLTVNGRTLEGNCDLCFLKSRGQRLALIQAKPEAARWWMRMEALNLSRKPGGARFRIDGPSYADLARIAASQQDLFFSGDEEAIPCFCGD
ncbi:MAG: phosphoadenosine phosphosulfate reductase family protein [Candidatus Accumulibacter sp.]|jgi:3'-phosphoadenosine 5'-phosphosulfate sulfotransferase (PAPS reductase)/FAD synthetase|nr:phosphoadenosine phosphosulfate reductase family protein [Accumulibacter sp.]